jgi:hypothetical protein
MLDKNDIKYTIWSSAYITTRFMTKSSTDLTTRLVSETETWSVAFNTTRSATKICVMTNIDRILNDVG